MDRQAREIATDLAGIANAVADLVGVIARDDRPVTAAEVEHSARALAQELAAVADRCEEIKRERIAGVVSRLRESMTTR